MPQYDVIKLCGLIKAPVLLVSGVDSWFHSERREDPGPYFQNARHEVVEDAGHWLHHDQLDQFLELARDFLTK